MSTERIGQLVFHDQYDLFCSSPIQSKRDLSRHESDLQPFDGRGPPSTCPPPEDLPLAPPHDTAPIAPRPFGPQIGTLVARCHSEPQFLVPGPEEARPCSFADSADSETRDDVQEGRHATRRPAALHRRPRQRSRRDPVGLRALRRPVPADRPTFPARGRRAAPAGPPLRLAHFPARRSRGRRPLGGRHEALAALGPRLRRRGVHAAVPLLLHGLLHVRNRRHGLRLGREGGLLRELPRLPRVPQKGPHGAVRGRGQRGPYQGQPPDQQRADLLDRARPPQRGDAAGGGARADGPGLRAGGGRARVPVRRRQPGVQGAAAAPDAAVMIGVCCLL
ncbi:hypothetical protein DFJ74DRAFT_248065 [Hyaloraphidium curvatum]|nr:hypothetical protein DFJ74DRAFT_248065 [Hyaloraphidium curvatum]